MAKHAMPPPTATQQTPAARGCTAHPDWIREALWCDTGALRLALWYNGPQHVAATRHCRSGACNSAVDINSTKLLLHAPPIKNDQDGCATPDAPVIAASPARRPVKKYLRMNTTVPLVCACVCQYCCGTLCTQLRTSSKSATAIECSYGSRARGALQQDSQPRRRMRREWC
jgi:hypothetical protein